MKWGKGWFKPQVISSKLEGLSANFNLIIVFLRGRDIDFLTLRE